tara:strand:+ start:474 stop:668 length:195 start_codon:yes stop_codon:yes gene_type:complete
MKGISAKMTSRLLDEMDEIIEEGWYANRSEFIRDAVRDSIKRLKVQRLEAAIKADIKWGLHGKD